MGMGNQGSSYEWNGANVQNTQGGQPLSIDTGLSNTRSVPTTPASTPPGAVQQGMSYASGQSFDGSRPLYSGPPSQPGQYAQGQPMMGYRQDGSYPKTEMAPPSRISDVPDEGDVKPADGMMPQGSEQVAPPQAGSEGEHDHDNEYTHSNAPYNGNRGPYGYTPNGAPGAMHPDHAHLSPEMTGSPHQNGSGRATPRTAATGQAQWNSGYATPQRQAPPSSNLYNVMSDPRGGPNGNAAHDAYQGPGAVSQYSNQGYAPTNGVNNSSKRGRDDEDQDPYRPDSVQGDDMGGLKRRKTMEGGAVGGNYADPNPSIQRAHTMTSQAQRVRR